MTSETHGVLEGIEGSGLGSWVSGAGIGSLVSGHLSAIGSVHPESLLITALVDSLSNPNKHTSRHLLEYSQDLLLGILDDGCSDGNSSGDWNWGWSSRSGCSGGRGSRGGGQEVIVGRHRLG
mgnify:CR=1 FL=1